MLGAKKIGNLLLILISLLLLFPVCLTLYMSKIIQNSELALVENQKVKLARALDDLDSLAKESPADILSASDASDFSSQERLKILNAAFKKPIDQVHLKYPQVKVGFYFPGWNIVIDGSDSPGESLLQRQKKAFWEVLAQRETVIQNIGQGAAGVLEIYRPYYRNGKLQGVLWAYENLGHTSFYARVAQVKTNSYSVIALGVFVGVGGSLLLIGSFVKNIQNIKNGLIELQSDLNKTLPDAPGEMGEISRAINQLAARLKERLRLEEKIQRQERLASLGKLVAGVAHEIRNPLTSISCYIQLWQKTHNPSPQALNTMYREVSRLESLVEQLLYFARPAEARFVPSEINKLVEKTLQYFSGIYQGQFTTVKRLAADLPHVLADPEQIERVLKNIIYNSYQAMPDGGRLEVETVYDRPAEFLVITVTDTGCGIPEEHLKHLFDPFFSTKEKGTGLGLAIAYEIVQAHGGNIEVASKMGQGTTFRVYISAPKV